MLIFTAEGPRSVNDRDVTTVFPGGGDGRYTFATLVMADGTEVEGAVANAALARLEGVFVNSLPPAAQAHADRASFTPGPSTCPRAARLKGRRKPPPHSSACLISVRIKSSRGR